MNTRNQEQLNQLPKEMLVQLYLQMDSALDTIMEQNRKITEQNERQAHQIEALQENLAVLVQNRFGRKTEKVKQTDGQYSLDFDTMTLVLTALFPDGYTELPAEKMCPLLEYTPAHMQQVINHVHVYKGKDGTIVKAERPQRLFKGSIATPSLISAVMNSKYINAVPLNRCAQEFAGNGAVLSREVLATWMIRVSERYFSLLHDRMHQKLLESRLVHCDETPFVVVRNGKSSGTKDYMWVYHTGPEHGSPPVYLYQYSPTRKTDPSSDTGRALNYSLNQEPYLRTFLENGEVPLDNNDAERSIKKFCVGKKNWKISATKNGAEASGILYSIAETARANGLRPYYYFKHMLETMIPHMDDKTTDFLEELMPWSESLPEVCRSKEK